MIKVTVKMKDNTYNDLMNYDLSVAKLKKHYPNPKSYNSLNADYSYKQNQKTKKLGG